MKIISAKEARERFNKNASERDKSVIDRVLEDIHTRIADACSEADHICDTIIVSFQVYGNGSSAYAICHPKTFVERCKYNWNEGYLWIQLTNAEEAQVMNALEDSGYLLTVAGQGDNFRNIRVSW